ncbi:MAG: hypothetical protein HND44_23785 [Chloroflexi bacterium]|nr:hypothetical protein [Ardenticatenaceae bacterium]MBL1131453.1 hypothetical protein [Chloroflexota bacterium]NOG37563.1 hypothetical protein [Chloroflexota bacterium]
MNKLIWLIIVIFTGVGCSRNRTAVPTPVPTISFNAVPAVAVSIPQESALARPYGYTYQRTDGNRVVAGQGNVPNLTPIDILLDGTPQWVTAVPLAQGVLWGVVLADGRTQAFLVNNGEVTPIASNDLTPAIAPVLTVDPVQGQALFLNPPSADPAGSAPIIYNNAGHLAHTNAAGELTLVNAGEIIGQPPITALPDARILFDGHGRLLLLTDPTGRYPHGVLGDSIEAGGFALIQTDPEIKVIAHFLIPEPQVVEGIMPLWADWNGDGQREILLTLSDAEQGAQLVLFSEAGVRLAAGPAIGQGNRWRHQIAIAPFGPNGEMELTAVRTPHLESTVEFYRWQGNALQLVAQLPGYTSHSIGSRNLDMAMAGDFNGDGRMELLLPTAGLNQLGGIQRTNEGATTVYHLGIGGKLASNLAGVAMGDGHRDDGNTAVGLGRTDNVLRIWQP